MYSITTLLALSLVSHKEQRFMSSILPLFAISSAFFIQRLATQGNDYLKKFVVKSLYFFYILKELRKMITYPGDKDFYNFQTANSPILIDYSDFE